MISKTAQTACTICKQAFPYNYSTHWLLINTKIEERPGTKSYNH